MSLSKSSINSEQNFTPPNSNSPCIYEFDDFRLDSGHLMLYKNGTTISLKPKVVETLVALVERPGEVISKDELMDRVWQGSFVEESNLSQNIYQLRKTLGTCAGGQPLIETFWRRGYRFNGKVRQPSDVELLFATHTKTLVVTEEETIEDSEPERNGTFQINGHPLVREFAARELSSSRQTKSVRIKVFIGAAVLISGALLIFAGAPFLTSIVRPGPADSLGSIGPASVAKMTRMTPDLNTLSAAISPDGKYLTYDLEEKGKHSLWIKDVLSGGTSRLTPPIDVAHYDVAFSPDGKYVFYNTALKSHPNRTVFTVPTTGGEPQAISYDVISPLTISPDGGQIAFVRHEQLVIAQTDGSGERILQTRAGTTSSYESWGSNLSWSPDGTRIAICGSRIDESARRLYELIEVSVDDGTERNIPIPDWNYLDDVQWLHDQTGLIVRARETEASPWQIWRVSYPGGEISRITNDLNNYDNVSLSADSRLLLVVKQFASLNIWTMPVDAPSQAKQITFGSDANDGFYGIALTPDGKIIYTSPRGGNVDLWMMNGDGTEQHQLTKNAGGLNSRPRVTPDGRTIVFVSSRTGIRQVWRMDADGGNPSQLTRMTEDLEAEHPVLSPDGAWVYFNPFGKGSGFIAKIPINGGEPMIVRNSGWPFSISPNGKLMSLAFYDKTSSQPWKNGIMSLENRKTLKVFEEGYHVNEGWTADSRSLLVGIRDNDRSNLWLQPIDGSEPRQLTKFDGGILRSFAISPDFKQIAIARGNPSSEAVLITGF